MKAIGGYFELELNNGGHHYHATPYKLKSGRASLSIILQHIRPVKVYLPFYTCDTLLEPFAGMNIAYQFYTINQQLEPANLPELGEGEYFLYINYFDLKRDTANALSARYKDKLIIDCTQAFFMQGNGVSWLFNSCRKFFGVPDGSYLYAPDGVALAMPEDRNEIYETGHLVKRFNGDATAGYKDFIKNEELMSNGVLRMSLLTEALLSNVNYSDVVEKRREHFSYLDKQFSGINKMNAALSNGEAPMSYPLMVNYIVNKPALFDKNIFIPTFWHDTRGRGIEWFEFEKSLSFRLLPLPIDHRYSLADMERLCESVKSIL